MDDKAPLTNAKKSTSGADPTFSIKLAAQLFLHKDQKQHRNLYYSKLLLATFLLILIFVSGVLTGPDNTPLTLPQHHWLLFILSTAVQLFVGIPLYHSILSSWRMHSAKSLIAIAALLSYFLSISQWLGDAPPLFFSTSAFIILVTTLLLYSENKRLAETSLTQKIRDLRPLQVLKQEGSQFHWVKTASLVPNDIIKVPAGHVIPLDGVIISGTTSVNEECLTGQFTPILKGKGDAVIGTTLNRDSDIIIQINRDAAQNTLDTLIAALEKNFGTSESLCKKATVFTKTVSFLGLIVLGCAAYVLLAIQAQPLYQAAPRLLSVLISFSSISLVPAALIAGNTFMVQIFTHGIVFNKANLIETLSRLKTLFFDKTGTLTKGNFEYSQCFIELGTNQGDMLSTLFSLEQQSHHPLSQSMETHPWYQEIPKHPVRDFKPHPGLGICGYIQPKARKEYFSAIGNLRFLKRMQMQISRDMKAKMDELESIGETVLLCGYDRQVRGLISFSDTLRPGVRETLKRMKSLGIEPAIITGDSVEDIKHLTMNLGMTKIYSRCTPEEKMNKINREINSGRTTGFIGDKSVAEGVDVNMIIDTGTDIHNHKADVIFMNSDFSMIAWLLKTCRQLTRSFYTKMALTVVSSLLLSAVSLTNLATPELVTALILILNLYILMATKKDRGIQPLGQNLPSLDQTSSSMILE